MGAGIAKKIKDLFPKASQKYKKHISGFRPGMIQVVPIKDRLYICNLAGQDGYKSGKVDKKQYKNTYYREVLAQVGIEQVLKDLKGFGNKVALVCYEKSEDFCHRHIVGQWVEYLTGHVIREA